MLEATLFDSLRPWLLQATGLPECIENRPGAPRPVVDYIMVDVLSCDPIGQAHEELYDDNPLYTNLTGTEKPDYAFQNQEYEWILTINIYAARALDYANRLVLWRRLQQGRELLGRLNAFSSTPPTRIPELIDNTWTDRAVFNMSIRGYIDAHEVVAGGVTTPYGRITSDLMEEGQVTTQDPPSSAVAGSYKKP